MKEPLGERVITIAAKIIMLLNPMIWYIVILLIIDRVKNRHEFKEME